jgi:hypothetical protein
MDQDENGRRSFRFIPGPIFTQLLMADEINRASPRTQSALLQAMQEYHVTVAGDTAHAAAPLPRAGNPEPARAGRHLSRCPKPSSTASSCRSTSPIRKWTPSAEDPAGNHRCAEDAVARPAITMERLMAIQH